MKKKKKKREKFYLKLRAMSTGRWAASGLTNVSYNHVSGLGWQVDWALAPERKKGRLGSLKFVMGLLLG
jgi:hypothetical protein